MGLGEHKGQQRNIL